MPQRPLFRVGPICRAYQLVSSEKGTRGGGVGGSWTDEPDWSSRQMSTNKNVNDLGLLDFWDVESSLRLV